MLTYMPIGFGKNGDDSSIQPLNNGDLQEIKKIDEMLNPTEEVLVVARQSRIRLGGSAVTPNIIYATNRRIIIRDPYMMGIKENIVDILYDVIIHRLVMKQTPAAVAGTLLLASVVAIGNIQPASAQLPDNDDGASSFAPRGNEPPTSGGWMPMERPGWDPNGASEDNPGQSAQDGGIIGCPNKLKCTNK